MEIVYFVLGVVTVLLVFGVVIMVKIGTLVKELRERIGTAEQVINVVEGDLHRRVDDMDREFSSLIDSKFDKLQNKIKQKDLLKG